MGSPAPAPAATKGDGLVLLGLMLGILLAALDSTVVGTSLGRIVADIGGFEHFAWLFAAYMLTSTAVIPLAGKLSDRLGRRPVYLAGMAVFLLGSALCGLADSMMELIVYRGVQGLGGGVLFPVALATVADLYAPSERGKVQGAFGAVFGLASVLGPFLGGWIVDNVHLFGVDSWRWVFYVNVPVGAVAIAIVALHFPRLERHEARPLDLLGMTTLTVALVAGLLVTVWGGETFAWDSPEIVVTASASILALGIFVAAELRAKDPVIPLALFRNAVFTVSAIAMTLLGVGMFGVITFLPTFMQGVVGISATSSGAVLTPLMLAIVAGSMSSGLLMKRTGYKVWTVAGPVLVAVGYVLLSRLGVHPAIPFAIGATLVVGLGLGFVMQTFVVASQNVVERRQVGAATSTLTLMRMLGGTVGVTLLGVALNRRLATEIPAEVPAPALAEILRNPFIAGKVERIPSLLLRPEFTANAPPPVVEAVKVAFAESLTVVWFAGAAIAGAAFVVALFLKSVPLKSSEEYHKSAVAAAEGAPVAAETPPPASTTCSLCGKRLGAKVWYERASERACGACYLTVVPPAERGAWTRVGEAPAPATCRLCASPLGARVRYADPRGGHVCGNCYFGRLPAEERPAYVREAPA